MTRHESNSSKSKATKPSRQKQLAGPCANDSLQPHKSDKTTDYSLCATYMLLMYRGCCCTMVVGRTADNKSHGAGMQHRHRRLCTASSCHWHPQAARFPTIYQHSFCVL